MPDDHPHAPVLLDRCVELLTPALTRRGANGGGAVLVDATLGAGGHAERFLTELPGLHLIGLDRDRAALSIAAERLAPFGDRVTFVQTRYDGFWAERADDAPPSMACSSTSACRRCNSTVPNAASPTPTTHP